MKKILFVCLGNICRSSSAEEIMRTYIRKAGLEQELEVDSAGILSYHQGELPDWILGMDDRNIDALKEKAPDIASEQKIHRMTDFCRTNTVDYVPDPYYGGAQGFEHVLDILEDACAGLLETLRTEL